MKTSRLLCSMLVMAGGAVLAGCATTNSSTATGIDSSRYQFDAAYVQAVEHMARNRGVSVHWVNPPERRATPAQAIPASD